MEESTDCAGLGALGKASLIQVRRSLYARLAIEEDEGLAWLVGAGPSVASARKEAWEIRHLDFKLFCSLYNLVREPLQWDLPGSAVLFSGASVDEHLFSVWVSQEDALAWCAAYGLPVVEKYKRTPEGWLAARLRVSSFQQKAVMLYLLYELWKALQDDDWNRLDHYLTPFLPNSARGSELKGWTHTEKVALIHKLIHKEMNRQLRHRIGQALLGWPLGDPNPPKLLWYAKSLLSVAHFELSLLMTRQESPQRVKSCRGCLRLFAGHGNSQYCASWSRKKSQVAATP